MISRENLLEQQLREQNLEIERLNKENKELNKICARKSHYIDKKDLEITQKDNEIERLKIDYQQANDIIVEQDKEIERLKQKLLIGKKANILFFDEVGVDKE